MLIVKIKPIVQSVTVPIVIMPFVIMLSVTIKSIMPNVTMLSGVMRSAMQSVYAEYRNKVHIAEVRIVDAEY